MKRLIEALQILLKYDNPGYPVECGRDVFYIHVSPEGVSPEDIEKLYEIGFVADADLNIFYSFKYG